MLYTCMLSVHMYAVCAQHEGARVSFTLYTPYTHTLVTHTHTRRCRDYVTKGVVYNAIAVRHDGSSVFVAGSDGSLRV